MGNFKKITRDLYQVGGSGFTSSEDAAIYLIHAGNEAALVDSGCGFSVDILLRNIQATGLKLSLLKLLLLTHNHFDHTGGAFFLRSKLDLQTVAHILDARYIEKGNNDVSAASWYGAKLNPCPIDIKLEGKITRLKLGDKEIIAHHIPGHSPGSVVYEVESENQKVLFAQDVHGPLSESLLSNTEDYHNSLEYLLSLGADILCEGHYGVYRGQDEVANFIRSFMSERSLG